MGSSDFAMPIVRYLYENFNLVALYTKEPKKSNRGMKLTKTDSNIFAEKNGIPCETPIKFLDDDIKKLKSYNPDYIIVASYGVILPKAVLEIPKKIPINAHGSLLPRYRGASPIQYSILNDDIETGVTLQKMGEGVDDGDILLIDKVPLNRTETHEELMKILGNMSVNLFKKFFSNDDYYIANAKPQNTNEATFTKKIKKEKYYIDFRNESAELIERKVRAYDGNTWCFIGNIRVKIIKVRVEKFTDNDYLNHIPGDIINDKFLIKCLEGLLLIEIVKPESKKEMRGEDFLRGRKELIGNNVYN